MAVSREWTEWHLTPAGWVSGSSRRTGEGNVWRDEPEDRIITFVYQEQPQVKVEESWRSKTAPAEHIEQLLAQHGHCPRKL
jgi:hypothetical protein